jgi:hypothetical protein
MNPDCVMLNDNYPVGRVKERYSQKEIDMLLCFITPEVLQSVEPLTAYRLAAEEAFRENLRGAYVQSLRRTYKAFCEGTAVRNSSEWDAMINVSLGSN